MRAVTLLLALALSLSAGAAIQVYNFDDPAKETRFRQLNEELRCPKCQNQNIADSNAPLSNDLRDRVYQMIQAGHSDDAIIDALTLRYGDFITYRPPLRPATYLLWFGPLLLVGTAAVLVGWWVRRRAQEPEAVDASAKQRIDEVLAHYGEDPRP